MRQLTNCWIILFDETEMETNKWINTNSAMRMERSMQVSIGEAQLAIGD